MNPANIPPKYVGPSELKERSEAVPIACGP